MAPSIDASCSYVAELQTEIVWCTIQRDARAMSREQTGFLDDLASQLMPGILEDSVLKWASLEEALATHLASKLSWAAAPTERWQSILFTAFKNGISIQGVPTQELIKKDLLVIKERDPACPSLGHAFLYFKGFHGLQVHRAANWLWHNGQRSLASVLQSRASEVFGMDIHPAAQIGCGVMIDHGTGVVIGETAKVGNGCTLLHGVTLGGTGKQHGDRHPKLGSNVLVGAGASILGNVSIGDGAKIGASAVVLTDIPPSATAVGCPAKVIGKTKEANPASVLDHTCKPSRSVYPEKQLFVPLQTSRSLKDGLSRSPKTTLNGLLDVVIALLFYILTLGSPAFICNEVKCKQEAFTARNLVCSSYKKRGGVCKGAPFATCNTR